MAGISLSGLASGVDTSSIVDQLMALERQKITTIGYRKAAVTGQQDALKEVASKLSTLKDAALALSSDSTWTQKQTVESSDPARVAVSMLAGAGIGGQSISVDRLASSAQRRFNFQPGAFDAQGKTTGAETITLQYASPGSTAVTIDLDAGATKQQIADAINAKTTGPAVAAVVKDADGVEQLYLSARKTGKDSEFTASFSSAAAEDGAFVRATGNDLQAAYRVGAGAQQLSSSNVVENAMPGVRLTLKGVTTAPVTVTVTEPALDRDAIKSKVKSFVDAYNAVVDTTRSKITEQRVKSPTSDFQAARGYALRRHRHERDALAAAPGHVRRGQRHRHQRPGRPRHREPEGDRHLECRREGRQARPRRDQAGRRPRRRLHGRQELPVDVLQGRRGLRQGPDRRYRHPR